MPRNNLILCIASTILLGGMIRTAQGDDKLVCSMPQSIGCDGVTAAHAKVMTTAQAWLQLVSDAKRHIDIDMTYFINQDPARATETNKILAMIKTKAEAGVKVRLFLDGNVLKYKGYDGREGFPKHANISMVLTTATNGSFDMNHKKMIVIDLGEKAYVGSANFDANMLDGNIADCGLLVDGTAAKQAYSVFARYHDSYAMSKIRRSYESTAQEDSAPDTSGLVCSQFSAMATPWDTDTSDALVRMIKGAATSIDIQMYQIYSKDFYPGKKTNPAVNHIKRIYSALESRCIESDVRVRFLVDSTPFEFSHFKTDAGAERFRDDVRENLPNCLRKNLVNFKVTWVPKVPDAKKFDYDPQVHSKFMIVDGKYAWIGSENWEDSYFNGGSNCGVVTSSASEVTALKGIFDSYFTCVASRDFPIPPLTTVVDPR